MGNRHKMQFVFTSFYSIPAQLCHYMDNSLDTHKKTKKGESNEHPHLNQTRIYGGTELTAGCRICTLVCTCMCLY